jgi:membrane-bound lytic murein transglycosylase B
MAYAQSGDLKPEWSVVAKRLHKAGLRTAFVKSLREAYDGDHFDQILELNTLLFLRKADYHGVQVNDEAVTDVRSFMDHNRKALKGAEQTYGVSPEVIASLLWLESRYGKNEGHFHVPSVFVDLVQADRPEVLKHLYTAAQDYTPKVTKKVKHDILSRAKKRVTWAISELKAIQTMQTRNPDVLKEFYGSFAGAFGMAQFEPSSYVHYAKSYMPKAGPPDLESADDAIQSVANYLKLSGWNKSRKPTFVKSLMKYNNSHDYANAILKLAKQATPSSRKPAGKKKSKKIAKVKEKEKEIEKTKEKDNEEEKEKKEEKEEGSET